jgi:hypothetical protein
MRVIGFYTRKYRGDTAIVKWNGEVVALDRDRLEAAVGGGAKVWVERGDFLPSTYSGLQPLRVDVPADVLTESYKGGPR